MNKVTSESLGHKRATAGSKHSGADRSPASGGPQTPCSCCVNLPLGLGRVCQRFWPELLAHSRSEETVQTHSSWKFHTYVITEHIMAQRVPSSPAHWPGHLCQVWSVLANDTRLVKANIAGHINSTVMSYEGLVYLQVFLVHRSLNYTSVQSVDDLLASSSFRWQRAAGVLINIWPVLLGPACFHFLLKSWIRLMSQ